MPNISILGWTPKFVISGRGETSSEKGVSPGAFGTSFRPLRSDNPKALLRGTSGGCETLFYLASPRRLELQAGGARERTEKQLPRVTGDMKQWGGPRAQTTQKSTQRLLGELAGRGGGGGGGVGRWLLPGGRLDKAGIGSLRQLGNSPSLLSPPSRSISFVAPKICPHPPTNKKTNPEAIRGCVRLHDAAAAARCRLVSKERQDGLRFCESPPLSPRLAQLQPPKASFSTQRSSGRSGWALALFPPPPFLSPRAFSPNHRVLRQRVSHAQGLTSTEAFPALSEAA